MPPYRPPTFEELIDQLTDTATDYIHDLFQSAAGELKTRVGQVPIPQPPEPRARRVQGGRGRPARGPRTPPARQPRPEPRKPVRTAYTVLGVDPGAELEVMAAAFRAKARLYHPDVTKDPRADERMKELNAAWAILKDPEKRQKYDRGMGL